MTSSNDATAREEFRKRLDNSSELNITVTGRKTKRKFTTPVWFVQIGRKVILVPNRGSDNNWFKDLMKDPRIGLGLSDVAIPFNAMPVTDSSRVEAILDKFRAKYRSMWSESYYVKRDVYVEVPI